MKCSLKELFVLLIIYIAPTEGTQPALYLGTSSVQDKPMNLQQLRATRNRLQDLDSFPVTSDSQLHKIVKKQMDASDYRGLRKNKRSVFLFPEKLAPRPSHISKVKRKSEPPARDSGLAKPQSEKSESFFSKLFTFARDQSIRRRCNDPANQAKHCDKQTNEAAQEETKLSQTQNVAAKPQQIKNDPKMLEEVKDEIGNIQAKKKKINIDEENLKQIQEAHRKLKEMSCGDNIQDLKDEKKLKKFIEDERAREIKEEKKLRELIQQEKEEAIREEKKVKELIERKDLDVEMTKDKQKEKKLIDVPRLHENPCLRKQLSRIPDAKDYRYYYECESRPNGCLKLRHKRCPQGQFFSFKYLKCLKEKERSTEAEPKKRQTEEQKKTQWFDRNSEDSEPSNEWLDVNQGVNQKIPPEFKPKKKPGLKIYHLRVRRKFSQNEQLSARAEGHHSVEASAHNKLHTNRHHLPRSFVVKINKKEWKDQIAENDDNEKENDEEDKESDEEEEDDEEEDADEEDEESEEEEVIEKTEKEPSRAKEGLRDLFKSAKEAVTKRAKFEDPSLETSRCTADQAGSKKSQADDKKKVLIDANIRVDSTLSSVVKNLLKNKRKESGFLDQDGTLIGVRDPMNPVFLQNSYETLLKNNPRVKRYFLNRGVGEVATSGELRTN